MSANDLEKIAQQLEYDLAMLDWTHLQGKVIEAVGVAEQMRDRLAGMPDAEILRLRPMLSPYVNELVVFADQARPRFMEEKPDVWKALEDVAEEIEGKVRPDCTCEYLPDSPSIEGLREVCEPCVSRFGEQALFEDEHGRAIFRGAPKETY